MRLEVLGFLGLIPARAGKTISPGVHPASSRAHPRSRGENAPGRSGGREQGGSSPLARGKRVSSFCVTAGTGLIPARAGKTDGLDAHGFLLRAHPRSRGENENPEHDTSLGLGSSPLARGKLGGRRALLDEAGLIPARAGKTTGRSQKSSCRRAHPRSRGENMRCFHLCPWGAGSSPLARGKPERGRHHAAQEGLIPARAGKTRRRRRARQLLRAHPRSRGENAVIDDPHEDEDGSSPLARGKRSRSPAGQPHTRLIPARAGKTVS